MASRLRLLDGFALEHAVKQVELPPGMQRLLALLALHGPAHRCLVAGTLWPEVPESQALASLRTGVWRLNRMIPGLLLTDGSALSMSTATSVDSRDQEAFATSVMTGRQDDLDWDESGLHTLWPGVLLPGWYDDWVVFERERLSMLRLHALEHAATVLTRRGALRTALRLALEAVRTEPLRETATAVLMDVYLAEGNVSDAIRQYDMYRDLLGRELGVAPSRRLASLLP
jgi:DNA-binding SARP family transcriptional activator